MAQTTVDFTSNVIDGTAGGASGDTTMQFGDFIFTIAAQGNWTANLNNGRFTFAEDASVGSGTFTITVTTASGDLLDLADYTIVSTQISPVTGGGWPGTVTIDNTNFYDNSLGTGSGTYSTMFGGQAPIQHSTSVLIEGGNYIDTNFSGTVTFTMDNLVFDTAPSGNTNDAPTLSATGSTPTFTENGAAVDLFSAVTAATNDAGQTFAGMKLTVSNVLDGASEKLTIGGTAVGLANGTSGTIAGVGNYTVSVSGTTATITLSGMTQTNANLGSLIDGITYSHASEDPTDGNRVVTITQLTDSGSSSNTVSPNIAATVNVNPVNDAPTGTVNATLAHGLEDNSYVVSVADLIAGVTDADGDTMTLVGLSVTDGASVSLSATDVTVIPAANFHGSVFLTYTITDNNGGFKLASHTITFDAANDAPTGSAGVDLENGTEDTPYDVTAAQLLSGFSDIDGDTLQVTGLGLDNGATFTQNGSTYTITPAANFNGAVTISYTVSDGNGGTSAATRTVTFDASNDDPTGSASLALPHGTEDQSYTVSAADLLQGYSDPDGDTLTLSSLAASNGAAVANNGDGTYTITPVANFNGAVSLNYTVSDGNGGTTDGSQSITFDAVNDGPTATDDTGSMDEGQSIAFDVTGNDNDVDGDALSPANPLVTSGNGSVTIDGNGDLVVTYTGQSLQVGETADIVITYDATDGSDDDSGTLTVTVNGVYNPGDDLDGTNASETIIGSSSDETIDAGGGDDVIKAGGGDDEVQAGKGDDTVMGGDGDDDLRGGEGRDVINGGKGDDRIVSWGGDDRLTGGPGLDTFIFKRGDGDNVITDFEVKSARRDLIDLTAFDKFETFADVKSALAQDGQDVVLELTGGNSVTLKQVDLDDLGRAHFLL